MCQLADAMIWHVPYNMRQAVHVGVEFVYIFESGRRRHSLRKGEIAAF